MKIHPESLVLDYLLDSITQFPKLPQPELRAEHTDFTTGRLNCRLHNKKKYQRIVLQDVHHQLDFIPIFILWVLITGNPLSLIQSTLKGTPPYPG